MSDTYTASGGDLWHLEHICPPWPNRSHDWRAVHDAYEWAPDVPNDPRVVYGPTREAAIEAVEAWIRDEKEEWEAQ